MFTIIEWRRWGECSLSVLSSFLCILEWGVDILFWLAWPNPYCVSYPRSEMWALPVAEKCEPLKGSRVQLPKGEWMSAGLSKNKWLFSKGPDGPSLTLYPNDCVGNPGNLDKSPPFHTVWRWGRAQPNNSTFTEPENSRIYPSILQAPFRAFGGCRKMQRFLMSQSSGSPPHQLTARKSRSDSSQTPCCKCLCWCQD